MYIYNIYKTFTYSELSSTQSIKAVLDTLENTYLSSQWSSVLPLLKGETRDALVAKLEAKLCAHDPSIPSRVDTWLSSKQTSGAAMAEKTFPPLRSELAHASGAIDVLVSWLYWKYSNDLLGNGKGLSSTFLEKMFGDSLILLTSKEQWLSVAIACPYCSGSATLRSINARPRVDYRLNAHINCASCGHVEEIGFASRNDPSSLYCDCSHCTQLWETAAQSARQLSASTITSFATEIRRKSKEAASSLTGVQRQAGVSEVGQRFVAAFDSNPGGTLIELLEILIFNGKRRTFLHPLTFFDESWKMLPFLVSDGLVDAFFNVHELPADNHHLVECTIRGKENIWKDRGEGDRHVHALTTFLLGPKSGTKEDLKSWFKSADELGLASSWSVLPLEFQFSVNRARQRELARGNSSVFKPEVVHIYRNRGNRWSVDGSNRLSEILRELKTSKGLERTEQSLLSTVRTRVGPDMANSYKQEILALDPDVYSKLEELKDIARRQEDVSDFSVYNPIGKAIGKYFYWSMCREVVGEEVGVPLKWIMDFLNCQGAQFSKLIEDVSVPHQCPCCQTPGLATEVRLRAPHMMGTARFLCNACGHNEAFGIEHPNQLACECAVCSGQRSGLLAEGKKLALDITDRLVAGASTISKDDDDLEEFRSIFGDMRDSVATSYAQLRQAGKSPHETAHILFEGTAYDSTTYATQWPAWAEQAEKKGLLTMQSVEVLQGDEAKRFAYEALTLLLGNNLNVASQVTTLADVEQHLMSESGSRFAQGIEMMKILLGGGSLLPWRRLCLENEQLITELARRADEEGIEPSHVAKNQGWFKKMKRTAYSAPQIPAWKI